MNVLSTWKAHASRRCPQPVSDGADGAADLAAVRPDVLPRDIGDEFLEPHLAPIGDLQGATGMKAAIDDREDDRLEERLVAVVERTVYKDASALR